MMNDEWKNIIRLPPWKGESSIARGVSPWERDHGNRVKPRRGDRNDPFAPDALTNSRRFAMPQSFVSLHCHIVFSTKNRLGMIDAEIQPRLFQYIGGIVRARDSVLIAAGGVLDHVHLLVSLHKQRSISEFVRDVKASSSGWMHETFGDRKDFAWQAGYGAFAVSFSHVPEVTRYIGNQQEHHRVRTFQEEFRELLHRHAIEFDERYVWV